jgi:hypothetical protein
VTIVNGAHNFGPIPSYSEANNNNNPLKIELAKDTPYGESIVLDLEITFDDATLTNPITLVAGAPQIWFHDNFETNQGWTVQNQSVQTGEWERAVPAGSNGTRGDPPDDSDGSGKCYVTGNGYDEDLDGGPTILYSPTIDLSAGDAEVSYDWWFYNDDGDDPFEVAISNDNGGSWTVVRDIVGGGGGWKSDSFLVGDYVTPTADMQVRFTTSDNPNDSVTEAGVDAFSILTYDSPISLTLLGPPAIGTTVNVLVDAPSDGGLAYKMAAAYDTYPGFEAGGAYIPLVYDNLLQLSQQPGNPFFLNFTGLLDGSGQTSAPAIAIPNNPGLVGAEVFIAAVTLDSGVKNVSAPLMIVVE